MILSLPTDTPSFAITRVPGFGYPLREGLAVSLKCDVDSNPPSTAMWQKDDQDPPVSTNYSCNPSIDRLNISLTLQTGSPKWRWLSKFHINQTRTFRMVQMYSQTFKYPIFQHRILFECEM